MTEDDMKQIRSVYEPILNYLRDETKRLEEAVMKLAEANHRNMRDIEMLGRGQPPVYVAHTAGCVCPVGAQVTCRAPICPRINPAPTGIAR